MSNISKAFNGKKAFIPFVTSGDPSLEMTEKIVCALSEEGADVIELGIPFSDPVAEGPVIRDASLRALEKGVTADKIFKIVDNIRKKTQVPLVLMTYANPVFVYGKEKFSKMCKDSGVDGVIIPDVPFEEREEFLPFFSKHGIDVINMISPTTSTERIHKIAKNSSGFLYCVSSMGVTGMRSNFSKTIVDMIKEAKSVNPSLAASIGFGISNPQQAKAMSEIADGVIIGSAIVDLIAKNSSEPLKAVREFARSIIKAIR